MAHCGGACVVFARWTEREWGAIISMLDPRLQLFVFQAAGRTGRYDNYKFSSPRPSPLARRSSTPGKPPKATWEPCESTCLTCSPAFYPAPLLFNPCPCPCAGLYP